MAVQRLTDLPAEVPEFKGKKIRRPKPATSPSGTNMPAKSIKQPKRRR